MLSLSFLRLCAVGLFYLIRYGLARPFTSRSRINALRGRLLKQAMISLGPLYIKAGQIMATRSDLFSVAITDVLKSLHDDVPAMRHRQLVRVLDRAYRSRQGGTSGIFSEFDMTPVASASIAQVHRAKLLDGSTVAVKIVKHGVRRGLRVNIRLAGLIIRALHALSHRARAFNLRRRFDEIARLLVDQADMTIELANQRTIHANFQGHPFVRVPAPRPELSTADVLVMDFVDGIRASEPQRVKIDRAILARRSQEVIYTMLFMHGFCHGDPHPGNFFYSDDGCIMPVDFGIVVDLTEDEKWGLSSFIYACTRRDWRLATERFAEYFVIDRARIDADRPAFVDQALPYLQKHFDLISKHWSIVHFLHDINPLLGTWGAQYTYNFQKVILVFLSCEGLATLIDPDIDIWENARTFADRYSPYMNDDVKARFDRYFEQTIPRSLQMRRSAGEVLVAPTHLDRFVLPSAYPLFVEHAQGSRLVDVDGNTYVDLSCGYGPHILGYNHPVLREAVERALRLGCVNALAHAPEVDLAQRIVKALPSAEKVVFSNSGTEAVVQALRICRGYRRRDGVAKFEGHYHGFTDQGMVSSWFRFSGPKEDPLPAPGSLGSHSRVVDSTMVLQYGSDHSLDRLRREAPRLACVLLEPMPASIAEYNIPFLAALRALCTELDLPLVFDEVVSGFRVDYRGVQGVTGVTPDLTCLGKIIGGGLPCGAVAGCSRLIDMAKTTRDPFVDYETRVFVGGTMSGNSVTCAAGAAMLGHLETHPEVYRNLNERTLWLADRFREIAAGLDIPFRMSARHSIFSLTFSHRANRYYREKASGSNIKANLALAYYMRKHGTYMPELHTMFLSDAHSESDLEIVCGAFKKSLAEMSRDGFFTI